MRDNQRSKVYAAERRLSDEGSPQLTKREARAFCKLVCAGMSVPMVAIKWRQGGNHDFYRLGTIHMRFTHKNKLLHELAHYVVQQRYGIGSVQPHGPEFVGILGAMSVVFNNGDPIRWRHETKEVA